MFFFNCLSEEKSPRDNGWGRKYLDVSANTSVFVYEEWLYILETLLACKEGVDGIVLRKMTE